MVRMKKIERWVEKHESEYYRATRHPFIHKIRGASLQTTSFKRWLGQDYLFVRNFIPFVASVLIKCSKESDNDNDMDVILAGMASLNDEIAWFKEEAAKWDLQLTGITPHKTNQSYCSFLESLMQPNVSYTVAITAFWTIEAVYQQSFAHCLEDEAKTSAELRGACERWGNEGFGQYCNSLKEIANRRLSQVAEDVEAEAEATFLRVLKEEVEFWNMSEGD